MMGSRYANLVMDGMNQSLMRMGQPKLSPFERERVGKSIDFAVKESIQKGSVKDLPQQIVVVSVSELMRCREEVAEKKDESNNSK